MLKQIESAEEILRKLGFGQLRVRHHNEVARIEVPTADFEAVIAKHEEIRSALQALGYRFVTLDLQGFRSGSLNEVLNKT